MKFFFRGYSAVAIFLVCATTSVKADQNQTIFNPPAPEDFAAFVADITDPSTPLPSCEEVNVLDALGCKALCEAISGGAVDVSNTRDTNGEYVCTCETQVACSDRPTCEQLLIFPGRATAGCIDLCGDQFMAVEDEVEYAGDISAANKNMTHFIVECRCDGNVECADYILFSDLAEPETCDSLNIDSDASCASYCESAGGGLFDLGGNFTVKEGSEQGTCECQATSNALRDMDVSQACTDIPVPGGPQACTLQNPCPTEQGGENGSAGWYRSTYSAMLIAAGIALVMY